MGRAGKGHVGAATATHDAYAESKQKAFGAHRGCDRSLYREQFFATAKNRTDSLTGAVGRIHVISPKTRKTDKTHLTHRIVSPTADPIAGVSGSYTSFRPLPRPDTQQGELGEKLLAAYQPARRHVHDQRESGYDPGEQQIYLEG